MYTPKAGDRVRVTVEGVVHDSGGKWFDLGGNSFDVPYDGPHEATYTIEKLQDPEPVWVNGDVVEVAGYVPMHRLRGNWYNHLAEPHYLNGMPGDVSEAWRDGELKILYKADAA